MSITIPDYARVAPLNMVNTHPLTLEQDMIVGLGSELAELLGTVGSLRMELAGAQAERNTARAAHEKDIALIGSHMLEAAADNSMCNVFDEAVEYLNNRISIQLPTRKRNYRVAIQAIIYVDVEAVDEDDAKDKAYRESSNIERDVDRMDEVSTSHFHDSGDWEVELLH